MRISVFDNQHEAIKQLPEDRQGAFWMAFFAYAFDGTEPEFDDPMERMAWMLVLPHIEKSITASENGAKGGRPESQPKSQPETNVVNPHGKQTLSEEKRREGLGDSLKESLTPSPRVADAGGEVPAPPRAVEHVGVPCPDDVMAVVAAMKGGSS